MTYSARFRACLAEVLKWEGGWSNDPWDPGKETNKGITLAVYAAFIGAGAAGLRDEWAREQLVQELREIDDATVAEIYHRNYWQLVRGDDLPPGVDLAVFDFGVNSGPGRAVRHLQKCLGVGIDGHIGPRTLQAAREADPTKLIPALMDSRWSFMQQIKHFWRFKNGWNRRVQGVRAAALRMAGARVAMALAGAWATTVHPPLPDPDAQAATQAKAYEAEATSMAQSTTARASEVAAGLGTAQIGVEVAAAASRSRVGDGAIDPIEFLLALAQSPTFWIVAGVVASSAYVWLERRRRAQML